jgi:hypothetical protein
MSRRPQNGPSLSKAPEKPRKPMSESELAAYLDRKDAKLAEVKDRAANSRRLVTLLHNDPKSFLDECGLTDRSVAPPVFKPRRIAL